MDDCRLTVANRWWLATFGWYLVVGTVGCVASYEQVPRMDGASGVVLALVAICGYTDLRERRIRNWNTYPAILIALCCNGTSEFLPDQLNDWLGLIGFVPSLLGCVVCFGVKFVVYCIAKGGAGDVKLAAALGAFMGVERGLTVICYTYVLAGVAALCIVIWTRGPISLLRTALTYVLSFLFPWRFQVDSDNPDGLHNRTLPLGVFFAMATPLVMFNVDLLKLVQ